MRLGHGKMPRAWISHTMLLGHAMGCTLMRPVHSLCAPCMQKVGAPCAFLLPFWVKPALLAQTKVETRTINTILPRPELWQFKRKTTLELYESLYLLLDFLGYVFNFSNLFLVTMCN